MPCGVRAVVADQDIGVVHGASLVALSTNSFAPTQASADPPTILRGFRT
jgi:hypothetical protein